MTREQIEALIAERAAARAAGNYTLADKIRTQLYKHGIILEDTTERGTQWRRK